MDQAASAIRILKAAGFGIRKAAGNPAIYDHFSDEEIEFMAQLEHARWNVERLRDGWRLGPRDNDKKLHDCLLPWNELSDGPDGVKKYDRISVKSYPQILGSIGWEVYRL